MFFFKHTTEMHIFVLKVHYVGIVILHIMQPWNNQTKLSKFMVVIKFIEKLKILKLLASRSLNCLSEKLPLAFTEAIAFKTFNGTNK